MTGGAGFIGSNLCSKLAKNNKNYVVSLDNYSTGSLLNHVAGVEYITGDTKDISKLIDFSPDYIYHLGEYSRVEQSFDDVVKLWESNKNGTFAVLEFCRKTKAKLIYAGSSTKFSDSGDGRDQSPYSWTKATNSELVVNYGRWFDIKYAITYFHNVYGPGEISSGKYATLIAIFIEQFKKKQPLTVVSPGTQCRNFTHVDDIVSGLIIVGNHGQGDNFELGDVNPYSVLDIAELFGSDYVMLPERQGNRMQATINTARSNALGWHPTRNVADYIRENT